MKLQFEKHDGILTKIALKVIKNFGAETLAIRSSSSMEDLPG